MTFRMIAEAAGCGDRTVRRYARELWPTRDFSGGANLTKEDAMALISALPKRNLVTGQITGQMAGPFRLPSGSQLREIRLLAKDRKLTAEQVQRLLGLSPAAAALPAPEELDSASLDRLAGLRRTLEAAAAAGTHFPSTLSEGGKL